mmetsp:Transcript_41823/g.104407  ORF Transcript_41823/g.104407 Transcript_41823/m.104407 type:complete len:149 (-) Transcript_41823:177-623(-)
MKGEGSCTSDGGKNGGNDILRGSDDVCMQLCMPEKRAEVPPMLVKDTHSVSSLLLTTQPAATLPPLRCIYLRLTMCDNGCRYGCASAFIGMGYSVATGPVMMLGDAWLSISPTLLPPRRPQYYIDMGWEGKDKTDVLQLRRAIGAEPV